MRSSAGALEAASHIADTDLAPTAQDVDRSALVPRSRFEGLAAAGLFGIAGPTELGHLDLAPPVARRVMAAIAGGCGATFFCWVQHHGVVRTVRSSPVEALRSSLLDKLCTGTTMAGVAFAHLRRADRRAVTARRVQGGWSFDGHAPWATSWGIADVFAVAAESDEGEVVWGLIPGAASPTVQPRALPLPVLSSTGTVALEFSECVVGDESVIAIEDAEAWRAADRRRAAIGQPAVLGVAERAIRLLEHHDRLSPADADNGVNADADNGVNEAVRSLRHELDDVWRRDDALLADVDTTIEAASAHRARCLDLGRRATTALLAAVGGGGMDLGHPAQRLAREAMFYVIQAQTDDGRAATLRHSAAPTVTVGDDQHRG